MTRDGTTRGRPRRDDAAGVVTSARALRTALPVLLVCLALAGCTAGAGSSSLPEPGDPDLGVTDSGTGGAPAVGEVPEVPSGEEGTDADADRSVISTGFLRITADDPLDAASDAARIVEAVGGRIDQRVESPGTGNGIEPVPDVDIGIGSDGGSGALSGTEPSASLVVRIPTARLTATLDEIKALGEVESFSLSETDVTATTRDLDARIAALRTSVDRLTALLAGATTTADLIEIENALSSRQAELEGLEAQQRALADQVDLATISIVFGSPASAPARTPDDFLSGLRSGAEALGAFLAGALVALGVALPWLGAAAVVTGLVLLVIRRRRARSRTARQGHPPARPAEPDDDADGGGHPGE